MNNDFNIDNRHQIAEQQETAVPFSGINRIRIFLIIVVGAISTIFYVNNVMQINSLLKDNQILNKNFKNLKNGNEILRSKQIGRAHV